MAVIACTPLSSPLSCSPASNLAVAGITFICGTTTGLDDEAGEPSDGGCCDDEDVDVVVAVVVASVDDSAFAFDCCGESSICSTSESFGSSGSC